MPPKVRRPAAQVKAKAKAGVRAPRRGALRGLRRPGASPRGDTPLVEESIEEKWMRSEEVDASKLPVGCLGEGKSLVFRGTYWGGEVRVCGSLVGINPLPDRSLELKVKAEGTTHEGLLKWVTGHKEEVLKVHMCGTTCGNKVEADGLVHSQTVRLRKIEGEEGWLDNLKEESDELRRLREAGEALGPPGVAEAMDKKEKSKEETEKAKKKKKEKKTETTSDSSSAGGRKKKKKRKKKAGDKVEGQKTLDAAFKNTGLDPDPKVRKRIKKRLKRKLKKKKDSSTTTSSSSQGSHMGDKEDVSLGSEGTDDIFEDSHKIRQIAARGPGVLCAGTIKEMQRQLLSNQGTIWEVDKSPVPPLALQFYRQRMEGRMSGGMARESLTCCWTLDLLLQGRIAAAADTLAQRVKSLDMTTNGSSWTVAQRIETVPPPKGQLSSRSEAQAAAKESREEERTRMLAKGKDKGRGDGGFGSWKGGNKGEGKDRGGKGKTKKGEKEEAKK